MNIEFKIGKYLNEEKDTYSIQEKIVSFFANNPKPKDSDIHSFAESEGIDTHKFEEIVYDLLGSFLGSGRSKGFNGKIDPKELKMGIKVEMEHTTNPIIAKRIAMDHLAEMSDYYTKLAIMEGE